MHCFSFFCVFAPSGAGPLLRALGINYNEGRGVRESVGGVGIVVELVAQDTSMQQQKKQKKTQICLKERKVEVVIDLALHAAPAHPKPPKQHRGANWD